MSKAFSHTGVSSTGVLAVLYTSDHIMRFVAGSTLRSVPSSCRSQGQGSRQVWWVPFFPTNLFRGTTPGAGPATNCVVSGIVTPASRAPLYSRASCIRLVVAVDLEFSRFPLRAVQTNSSCTDNSRCTLPLASCSKPRRYYCVTVAFIDCRSRLYFTSSFCLQQ